MVQVVKRGPKREFVISLCMNTENVSFCSFTPSPSTVTVSGCAVTPGANVGLPPCPTKSRPGVAVPLACVVQGTKIALPLGADSVTVKIRLADVPAAGSLTVALAGKMGVGGVSLL